MVEQKMNINPDEIDPDVVLALIPDRGQFVLIRRKIIQHGLAVPGEPEKATLEWAFPGGRREGDETPEEAVVREAMEEVGLSVVVREKLLIRKHPNTRINLGYYYCERTNLSEVPQVVSKREQEEIGEIALVDAGEVINRFTSNIHPRIKDFILSFAQRSAPDIAAG